MKQFENNEIEALLRKLAETERAKSSRLLVEDSAEEHLDPDELSSFAEGRLPAATRSFYMAHLAACDRCRRIVAQLATASGAGSAIREPAVEEQGRWTFLTKFFSPTVMRYAMPTLAVVVLAVAVFVWMQRESATKMALRQNAEPATQTVNKELNGELADRSSDSTPSSNNSVAPVPSEAHQAKADSARAAASKETAEARSADTKSANAKPADAASSETAASTPTPAMKEVEVYAPPPPAKGEPETAKSVAQTTDEAEKKERTRTAPTEAANREEQAADKSTAARRSAAASAGRISGLSVMQQKVAATRSVGGKNFQRIDNVWVDTVYTSSTPTMNISRGSEQYRALTGDEPGLRTIAEQLSGEIVVVWKGKAYRIR